MDFTAVTTVSELLSLNRDEVRAGYAARHQSAPKGTRAFFHGWRTGRIDHGLMPVDEAYRVLNANLVEYFHLQCLKEVIQNE